MSANQESSTPLLEDEKTQKWYRNFVDCGEIRHQILFASPMILTNAFYYLITLVPVMFAGHLGELPLAGATLANSWSTVTGIAFMTGLSGALETLCGQAYGAQTHRMLGIYLQATQIISLIFCVIIAIIWWFTEPILLLLGQKQAIAAESALYLRYLIPGLFAYGFIQNILRFLQTQSVVWPLIALSGIPLGIHIGITYALVDASSLGYIGAPIAASISLWIATFVLALYVYFSRDFKETWKGFSLECFQHVWTSLKLALPSVAMVCLEYWAFEILVLLAGLMPDSEVTTSLTAMCVNTEAIAFMIVYGLSASASTRVSNELGAGNPERAKRAMVVTLELAVILAIIMILALAFLHRFWAGLFSSSSTIIAAFASLTPFLCGSIALDTFQSILSGVCRGCGFQNVASFGNLITFYVIGMPIAVVLGITLKFYTKGLWTGLICGLFTQSCMLSLVLLCRKWIRIEDVQENGETRSSDIA